MAHIILHKWLELRTRRFLSAVREAHNSRHKGCPIESPPETYWYYLPPPETTLKTIDTISLSYGFLRKPYSHDVERNKHIRRLYANRCRYSWCHVYFSQFWVQLAHSVLLNSKFKSRESILYFRLKSRTIIPLDMAVGWSRASEVYWRNWNWKLFNLGLRYFTCPDIRYKNRYKLIYLDINGYSDIFFHGDCSWIK